MSDVASEVPAALQMPASEPQAGETDSRGRSYKASPEPPKSAAGDIRALASEQNARKDKANAEFAKIAEKCQKAMKDLNDQERQTVIGLLK